MIPKEYLDYVYNNWSQIVSVAKGIGYIGGALTFTGGIIAAIAKLLSRAKKIDSNLTLVLTNHLPHIQSAIDETGRKLGDHIIADEKFQADISGKLSTVEGKVGDVKDSIIGLNDSFIRHLDSVNVEHQQLRAMVSGNKLDIKTLEAVNDIKEASKPTIQVEAEVKLKTPIKFKKKANKR